MSKKNKHVGSTLDDLLVEDGTYAEVATAAMKRVIAWEIEQAIGKEGITKAEMARRMHTSRASLDRLLDPDNVSVTLQTVGRAAAVLGKRLQFKLVGAT